MIFKGPFKPKPFYDFIISKIAQEFTAWVSRTPLWGRVWENCFLSFLHKSYKSKFHDRCWNQDKLQIRAHCKTYRTMEWVLFGFIEHSSEMKWVWIQPFPDGIVSLNGECAVYHCFLINAVRDKEEAGKNKDRSFIWTLANYGGITIQWKCIKKMIQRR